MKLPEPLGRRLSGGLRIGLATAMKSAHTLSRSQGKLKKAMLAAACVSALVVGFGLIGSIQAQNATRVREGHSAEMRSNSVWFLADAIGNARDEPEKLATILSYEPPERRVSDEASVLTNLPRSARFLLEKRLVDPSAASMALCYMPWDWPHLAPSEPFSARVARLISYGADPNFRSAVTDPTILMRAATSSDADTVRELLKAGARADAVGPFQATVMWNMPFRPYFVRVGATRFNSRSSRPMSPVPTFRGTALIEAAYLGRTEIVRELLAHGADPKARSTEGHTAREYAAKFQHADTAALLK
jgi:hypothetical protein